MRTNSACEGAKAALLIRRGEMDLEQPLTDLCPVRVLQVGVPRDRLAPGIEPRPDGKNERTRTPESLRLAKKEEAMVLTCHQGLVEGTRDHQGACLQGPTRGRVRVTEPREAGT